jgi:zinc transport system substrate-binding protein
MKRKLGYLLSVMLIMSLISYGIVKWNKTAQLMQEDEKEELVIVTSFYPMYIATLNVVEGIEGITVINLTQNQTGCVHDYQLTTKDMREIVNADIAIINGGELEGFMEEVMADYKELKVITASEGIQFLEGITHSHDEGVEHSDEADHENETHEEVDHQEVVNDEETHEEAPHEEEIHNHEQGAINGHVWMNMDLYQQQIATIAKYLETYDAKHAKNYEENASIYIEKIKALENEFDMVAKFATGQEIVIFHDAFAYLAQQLGMEVVHTVDTDSESALSAGEIAKVIEEVNLHSIPYLFTEAQYSTEIADRVAAETMAMVYVMNSLVTGVADKDAYLDGMRENLVVLKKALLIEQ